MRAFGLIIRTAGPSLSLSCNSDSRMDILRISVFLALFCVSHGYNILLLAPFNGPSHWLFLSHILRELINRGHHVTAITSQRLTGLQSSQNYTEVLIDPPYDLSTFVTPEDVYKSTYNSDTANIKMLATLCVVSSEYGLKNANVQKFIHDKNLHFDLVLSEQFFQESWLMFAHLFNAPIVTISTYGHSDFFDRAMGLFTPWSHQAHMLLSYSDNMTFTQRFYNVLLSAYDWIYRDWVLLPNHDEIAQRYFGFLEKPGQPLPKVKELEKNISVILVNSHRSTSPPRPMMPGIVNIGGLHIKPPKPLPADLQNFLDGSQHGVIYFSLGAFMKSANMPKEKIAAFLGVFGKLKQNVLWKFEDENLPNIPPNVMIRKWMPQSDILAHKNVILFISHGGMFGNFEAIERGVPMLFTPLYGDQHRNAQKAATVGYGRVLKFSDVNHETLLENLNELVSNKVYYNRAKELSGLFRDNVVHPMDEAIYWIEYVCRHKGAKHLKSHAVHMSWHSYLLLDILSVVVLALVAVLLLVYVSIKVLIRRLSATNKSKANKTKKRN